MWFHANSSRISSGASAASLSSAGPERIDVMEDAAGDDCIERPGIVELLQGDLPVEGTLGRTWIDREHVVAGGGQRRRDTALVATADLEHPTAAARQAEKVRTP